MNRTIRESALRGVLQAFLQICLCLILVSTVSAKHCDKTQCKGPIRYLEELKCKPIYDKPGDCCAIRYDCSHLSRRSKDKCYFNGKTYNIGQIIKDEDQSNPCNIGCTCKRSYAGIAGFTCAVAECMFPIREGCFLGKSLDSCCGREICPTDDSQHKMICEVDGQTYMQGMNFYPMKDPDLICQCLPGYRGENVKPFCRKIDCGTELHQAIEIYNKCPPVFYSDQKPQDSCPLQHRCQNKDDKLLNGRIVPILSVPGVFLLEMINNKNNKFIDNNKCKFGNLTMEIGDELNQATDYSSVCVRCVCEVPPTPTCQRLPDNECDVTNHPLF
ncbi:PREDICTED: kielin/chordin-like protein [Ceratosolen solmsi marchali]|uniref:Kielin/chordin-like protein n=1 Tax=Ceratosolen solmsi marchali TaxID=326594 RepID=A0AAJ6YUP5_9HYME|nr:PREDICTED: kielin/chordin-like protein [Ceratosolen solmsi marchali]